MGNDIHDFLRDVCKNLLAETKPRRLVLGLVRTYMIWKKMQKKKYLFLREIQIIKNLDHPNIIKSHGIF